MKIYKTLIVVEGDCAPSKCDTIEFQGALWLVPAWIAAPAEGWRRPERLIRLDCPRVAVFLDPTGEIDLVLHCTVPKDVIFGQASELPPNAGFEVIHNAASPVLPDIFH